MLTMTALSTCPGCGEPMTERCTNPFCWGPCLGVRSPQEPNVVRGED